MTREEWLAARYECVGGTDVPAILGKHKYKTAREVAWEKIHKRPLTEQNVVMEWGSAMEEVVMRKFELETGWSVTPHTNSITYCPDEPILGVSLDGEGECELGRFVVDCKAPSGYGGVKYTENELPEYNAIQVKAQMLCAKADIGFIAAYIKPDKATEADVVGLRLCLQEKGVDACVRMFDASGFIFRWYPITCSPDEADEILSSVRCFWDTFVLQGVLPDATTPKDATLEIGAGIAEIEEADFDKVLQVSSLRSKIKAIEDEIKPIEEELKMKFSSLSEGKYQGSTVFTYRNVNLAKRFNESKFRQEHPELYERYFTLIPQPQRRFTIKVKANEEEGKEEAQ